MPNARGLQPLLRPTRYGSMTAAAPASPSTPHERRPGGAVTVAAEELKACCASAYAIDGALAARRALPPRRGGTHRTAGGRAVRRAGPAPRGRRERSGTSAIQAAREAGCDVVGVDLSPESVGAATASAEGAGLADRVRFVVGDAEALPVADESADAVLCECALCTFPDKSAAAREFARVLRPGGSLALSDMTAVPERLPPELTGVAAWVACLGGARPSRPSQRASGAGLVVEATERHDDALGGLLDRVDARLRAARALDGSSARGAGGQRRDRRLEPVAGARAALADGALGYGVVITPADVSHRYDLVVVGLGSAGIVAAGFAARLGLKVAAVERDRVGGDCLWTGCVPSKAIIASARTAHAMRSAAHVGIAPVEPQIDLERVWARMRDVQQRIARTDDDPDRLRARGIEIVAGAAQLAGPQRVEVAGRSLDARFVLLCTGSRPAIPAIEGLEAAGCLTNETLFAAPRPPASLAIVGGGPVGVDVAQACARLGSGRRSCSAARRCCPPSSRGSSGGSRAPLLAEGVDAHLGADIGDVSRRAGRKRLELADGQRIEADELLVATGRTPNVDALGLAEAGVAVDGRGITVDSRLRTSCDRCTRPATSRGATASPTRRRTRPRRRCATCSSRGTRPPSRRCPGAPSATPSWPTSG